MSAFHLVLTTPRRSRGRAVTRRITVLVSLVTGLAAATACSSSGGGMDDAGMAGDGSSSSSGGSSSSGSSSGGDGGGPSFATTVYPIFMTSACGSCHSPSNPIAGGLDLSGTAMATYTALVNQPSAPTTTLAGAKCGTSTEKLVVPSDSAHSLLYDKVANTTPSCGLRMPQGGMLMAADIATIKTWIDQGASP